MKVPFRLGSVGPEGFKCNIETDLVSILENIGESLFTAVNPDGNAVEGMSFDADIERFGRKAKNLDWWMIEAWNACRAGKRHFHCVGNLSGQPMKCQRRQQAENGLGHLFRDCEKVRFARWRKLGQPKEATGNLLNFPAIPQRIECAGMNASPQRLESSQRSMALFEDSVRPVSFAFAWWIEVQSYVNIVAASLSIVILMLILDGSKKRLQRWLFSG